MPSQSSQFAPVCSQPLCETVIADVARFFSLRKEDAPVTPHTAEREDIRQSQSGDSEAYRRLIERHQASVGKLLWRFTRDYTEHEELVQQTFVEVWLSLSGFRGEAPFAHWLARIATRVGYNYWRQLGRQKPTPLPDEILEGLAHTDAESFDAQHAADVVHRLLAALPANDRLVLTMRYLEQCSIAQTAYRLGWTQTRVKVQTHRAVAKLKRLAADRKIELEL